MRKLLLALGLYTALAAPALADVVLKIPLADFPVAAAHMSKTGAANGSITIPVGTVVIIASGNKVGVFDPATNAFIPGLTVTTSLGEINAASFIAPNTLVMEGGFYGQVELFAFPPVLKPYFTLP